MNALLVLLVMGLSLVLKHKYALLIYFLSFSYLCYLVLMNSLPLEFSSSKYAPDIKFFNFTTFFPVCINLLFIFLSLGRTRNGNAYKTILFFAAAVIFHIVDKDLCTPASVWIFAHVFWHIFTALSAYYEILYINELIEIYEPFR
jgi:hypothetical protein